MKVFLSHAYEDLETARRIQSMCAGLGIQVYLFEDDLRPGANLPEKLLSRIHESDAVLALLTPSAAKSTSVASEIGAARSRGIPVVPFLQEGVEANDFVFLQGTEWIGFHPADMDASMQSLMSFFAGEKARRDQIAATAEIDMLRGETNQYMWLALGAIIFCAFAFFSSREQ